MNDDKEGANEDGDDEEEEKPKPKPKARNNTRATDDGTPGNPRLFLGGLTG